MSNTYIGVPVTTDADALAQTALQYLQGNIPGWVPRDGNLEVWLINALCQALATSRDVASIVPDQIFEYYGNTIMNLPPIAAASATVTATITAVDNAGYTIPAGTQFGFAVTGSQMVAFATTADVVIPPGSTTAVGVTLTAVVAGAAGNGLTGTMTAITPLASLASVAATTTSAGGVDAETSAAYLSRLVAEMQLSAPRPILPADFAALAQSVAGVYRALAIDGLNPGRTDTGCGTTAASPVVTDASIVAGDLGRPVTNANVPAASYVGTVTPGVSFRLSSSATSQVDVNATATAAAQSMVLGSLTGQARTVAVSAVDSAGNAVSGTIQTALLAYLQARRELNFVVNWVAPTYTVVNVAYSIHLTAGSTWTAVRDAVNAAIQNYLSQATWGDDSATPTATWDPTATVVRYLQVARIIQDVAGVAYLSALTLNGAAADVALTGSAPLANYGTITPTQV